MTLNDLYCELHEHFILQNYKKRCKHYIFFPVCFFCYKLPHNPSSSPPPPVTIQHVNILTPNQFCNYTACKPVLTGTQVTQEQDCIHCFKSKNTQKVTLYLLLQKGLHSRVKLKVTCIQNSITVKNTIRCFNDA